MFIRLTRQAEKATTANVSRTPTAYASARLAGLTEYEIVKSPTPAKALAITSAIP